MRTKAVAISPRRSVCEAAEAGELSADVLEHAAQTPYENAAIAQGLRSHDPEVLDRLIELHQHRLMRYLLFLTGKREVAEDLFQEVWIRVLIKGSQYNGKARFDTWLFRIARNLVIDFSRKRRLASLDEMCDTTGEIPADNPSPLELLQIRENGAEFAEALLRVGPNYREALMLRFHEEMSLEEIAGVTGAKLSTAKTRLYRGLAAIKLEIERLRTLPVAEDAISA